MEKLTDAQKIELLIAALTGATKMLRQLHETQLFKSAGAAASLCDSVIEQVLDDREVPEAKR